MNYDNTSVPTIADNATTSPCEGCDYVMTTFNVNEGHDGDNKSQLSLSAGESESCLNNRLADARF